MSKKEELSQEKSENGPDKAEEKRSAGRENGGREEPENDEKPLDFGGLPDRDLKKNLGCG